MREGINEQDQLRIIESMNGKKGAIKKSDLIALQERVDNLEKRLEILEKKATKKKVAKAV